MNLDPKDLFGKVSAIVKPDGTRMEYEYNPLGQLARKVARGGASSRLTKEQVGRAEAHPSSQVVVSDFLGTTLGTVSGESFRPVHLTAFGEQIAADSTSSILDSDSSAAVFYTGKPYDEDLEAYHFLYRNYSPAQARWTAADPSGFPDGPNQWLYVNNGVMNKVDALGLEEIVVGFRDALSSEGYKRTWQEELLPNTSGSFPWSIGLGFEWRKTGSAQHTPTGGKPQLFDLIPSEFEDDPNGYWKYIWRWRADEPTDLREGLPADESEFYYGPYENFPYNTREVWQIFIEHQWTRRAELVEVF